MTRFSLAMAMSMVLALPAVALAQDGSSNLTRFAAENAALGPPERGEERVVFMGDSITQGWADASPAYFEGRPYIERGISGETTAQMLARFRADVVDLEPAAVVILAGTNDIAGNQGPVSNRQIEGNLASMAEIAAANNIRVVLSSVLPVYDYPWNRGLEPAQRIVALNNWMEDYAEEHGHVFLDYYWDLVDERGGMAAPYTTDGVHVSKAGYEVMEGLAETAIAESLGRKPPQEEQEGGFRFEPIQGCASNVRLRSRRGDCD